MTIKSRYTIKKKKKFSEIVDQYLDMQEVPNLYRRL